MNQLRVRWYGHATFELDDGRHVVLIDPYNVPAPEPGILFGYPPLMALAADVLLVTHEHADHNNVDVVEGNPERIRSRAGTFGTAIGAVVGVASEHDDAAGTLRGANVMYRFELGGISICHAGDLGQAALRPEQVQAIGEVDVFLVPVGGREKVMDAAAAAGAVRAIRPRVVIPMHYGTHAINYLDPVGPFVRALSEARLVEVEDSRFQLDEPRVGTRDEPTVVVVPAPGADKPTSTNIV